MKIISLKEFFELHKDDLSHSYNYQSLDHLLNGDDHFLTKGILEKGRKYYIIKENSVPLKIRFSTKFDFDFIKYNDILYSIKIKNSPTDFCLIILKPI